MKPLIETERLQLREFDIADAEYLYYLNLNPNVIRYSGDKHFQTIQQAEDFLLNYNDYKINGYGRWAVIQKADNKFLGWCGLKYSKKLNETDIGFRFYEEHWNKGFATESAKACIDFGFNRLNIETIVGRAMKKNVYSIKVLEKIGLTYEKDFDFENNEGVIYRMNKI